MIRPQSAVILGAPGLGKSTLAGSVCEVIPPEEVLLMTAKPGEEKSWIYEKYGLTDRAELYYDMEWQPSLGRFKAGAYRLMMDRLDELRHDERYGAVIIDPGTDVISLIDHHLLAPQGVGSPGDLGDTRGYYRQLKDYAQEFLLDHAALLSSKLVKRPKWVLIPWHTQPAKEGEVVKGVKKESADEKAQGIEYEGNVLFQLEGGYRRKAAGDVDLVMYCDVETKSEFKNRKVETTTSYIVQVAPNGDRHAKMRSSPLMTNGPYPNNMRAIIEAMEEAQNG